MRRTKQALPKSPDAFRSIGEAAAAIGVQTHVLRYWEGKFPRHTKPVKRRDGRRMFRPADMQSLHAIRILVHERGMTLKGARGLLAEQGVEAVLSGQAMVTSMNMEGKRVASPARELQKSLAEAFSDETSPEDVGPRGRLESVLHEMNDLKARLDAARHRSAA